MFSYGNHAVYQFAYLLRTLLSSLAKAIGTFFFKINVLYMEPSHINWTEVALAGAGVLPDIPLWVL